MISRSQSFLGGALFAYVYQASLMLVGLWLTPFYIHTLGERDYGIWLVGLQVLNFLLLCDFGVIVVTPRDVANASGIEHAALGSGEVARVVAQTLKVVLAQTGVIALVVLGLFVLRLGHDVGLRGPVGLVLAAFVISYPLRLFPAVLQGLQDLKFLGQLRLTLWGVSTAVVIVMLLMGARFYALAGGWCLQQMGHDLVAMIRLRRSRPDLLSAEVWRRAGPMRWRWFAQGFWVNVGQAATALVGGSDLLIVGHAISATTVVVYSSTSKLITVLQNQPQILAGVALPGISHMRTSESRERILGATTSLTQAMLLLAGGVFCIILAVNQQFVTWWLRRLPAGGAHFFGGMRFTFILLLTFLLRQADYTLAVTLFAFGHEKWLSIKALVDGAVSVALALLLVRYWGIAGVAFGFLCGATFVSIPADFVLLKRTLQISAQDLSRPYLPYVWRFAVMGCVALGIDRWLGAPDLPNIIATASITGLFYLLLVMPYVWSTPLRGYIQGATTSLASAMRTLVQGWYDHG
jgi:O-antigen/teichoic acid export membrane protein